MNGKVIIVTGCTAGIGKETAREFARKGAKVIMACRNLESANIVKEELVQSTRNNNILVRKLDLSSLSSVREFAEQINREETRLDVLVHNAGTAESSKKIITEDGLEMTMATNHYGPFLLTHLLIDLLKRSAPSRIVVVASKVYRMNRLNLVDNPNPTSSQAGHLYFVSKYANILFTLELARRLQGSRVTVNCLHPGVIWTGMWNKYVPPAISWIVKPIIKIFSKTPAQGAETSIYLAESDKVAEVSGKYFMDCREHSLTRDVQNEVTGKKFWELSEGLVKLEPTDPRI